MRDVNTWLKRWLYCIRIVAQICIEIDYLASSSSCNVLVYWSCGIFFFIFQTIILLLPSCESLREIYSYELLYVWKNQTEYYAVGPPREWSRRELWIVILNSKAIINHSDRFDGYCISFESLIYCDHYKVVPSIWTVDFGWNLISIFPYHPEKSDRRKKRLYSETSNMINLIHLIWIHT